MCFASCSKGKQYFKSLKLISVMSWLARRQACQTRPQVAGQVFTQDKRRYDYER
jgi:hypothetical protein